jgi:hypothetical protein
VPMVATCDGIYVDVGSFFLVGQTRYSFSKIVGAEFAVSGLSGESAIFVQKVFN